MRTKLAIAASLLLAAFLAALAMRQSYRAKSLNSEVKSSAPAMAPRVAFEVASEPASPPFRWNQVESSDDAAYIRNLRLVGCPEGTVRDILTAAIAHRYDQRRQKLLDQQVSRGMDRTSLQEAVAQLWDEQNDLVAKLFGTPDSFGSGELNTGPRAVSLPARASSAPGAAVVRFDDPIPLALRIADPAWGLTDAQLAIWQRVADHFVQAIGGPDQDPKDPGYHARWKVAKAEADEQLRTQFGGRVFSRWQMVSQERK